MKYTISFPVSLEIDYVEGKIKECVANCNPMVSSSKMDIKPRWEINSKEIILHLIPYKALN